MIKLIALITMTIDHLGLIIFNNNYYLRLIGRIAYPLFASLIAYNYIYRSKNRLFFLRRLMIFAIISQPFFVFAFNTPIYKLNIFFQFVLGAMFFNSFLNEFKQKKYIKFVIINISLLLISVFSDYGIKGYFLMIFLFLFYYHYNNNRLLFFLLVLIDLIFLNSLIYIYAIIAIAPIIYYLPKIENMQNKINLTMNSKNKKYKYFFYAFYPLHIFIIKLLSLM